MLDYMYYRQNQSLPDLKPNATTTVVVDFDQG
jgi:hypothetical protein